MRGGFDAFRLPAVLGALFLGCGDADSAADDGGADDVVGADADADAGGDADTAEAEAEVEAAVDDGGGTGTLTVTVRAAQYTWWGMMPGRADWDWPVIEGATVAFDAPGGVRTEAVTDAEGRVTFDGFDWGMGTAAVTAWAEGYGLASAVGLDEDAEDPVLLLPPQTDPAGEWAEITGSTTNMADPTHYLYVQALEFGSRLLNRGPTWTLRVPVGEPATFVAIEGPSSILPLPDGATQEAYAWAKLSAAPFAGPDSVTLDLSASPLTPVSVTGTAASSLPADSALRGFPLAVRVVVTVRMNPGRIFMPVLKGHPSYTKRSAARPDGATWDFAMEYVVVDEGPTPKQVCGLENPASGWPSSYVWAAGYPADGALACDLVDAPRLTTPATTWERHPLHSPIEWQAGETGLTPALYVFDGLTNVWLVEAPVDATTLTVPEPPSPAGARALLARESLTGAVATYVKEPAAGAGIFARYADSAAFTLQAP